MPIHLIFEGAELSGKSYLMSLVYTVLEKRHDVSPHVLDGCFWINSDVGVFGTQYGRPMVEKYVEIARILASKNIIFEKLYLTDAVYQELYNQKKVDYSYVENELKELKFKTILVTFREDEELLKKRLADRLKLYPHYSRIAKAPAFYLAQQEFYRQAVKKSRLPYLEIDMSDLKDRSAEIIHWAQKDG